MKRYKLFSKDNLDGICCCTHSYYLVRYEDLVSDPLGQLQRLYAFMEVPFTDREDRMVRAHTGMAPADGEEAEITLKGGKKPAYYSTYRGADFNPNKWQLDLALEDIRRVEKMCANVMDELEYEVRESKNEMDIFSFKSVSIFLLQKYYPPKEKEDDEQQKQDEQESPEQDQDQKQQHEEARQQKQDEEN